MKLLLFEIKKLTSKRSFLVIAFLLLFTISGFLYMEQIQSSETIVSNESSYQRIKKEVDGKSLVEKRDFIKKKTDFFAQVKEYEEQINQAQAIGDKSEHPLSFVNQDFMLKYQELIQSDTYSDYTNDLEVYQYLYKYYNNLTGYDAYLDGIIEKTAFLKSNPMQASMSETKKQQLDILLKEYEGLRGIKLSDSGFLPVEQYANSSLPILLLFAWLFLTVVVMQSDDSTEMDQLITTTKKGKLPFRFTKGIVILILGCLCTLLIEGIYLLILQLLYGRVDWNISIQSIPSFYTSTLFGTVGSWYLITLFLKITAGFAFSMILAALYQWFQKISLVILCILFTVSYMLYQSISVNSIFQIFHYLNLYELGSIHEYFKDYTLFTFGSITISLPMLLSLGIILCILLCGTLFLFAKGSLRKNRTGGVPYPFIQHTSLTLHEFEKIIFNNRYIIICLLLCLYQSYCIFSIIEQRHESVLEDKVIDLYHKYGGILDSEKRETIEKVYQEYEKKDAELANLSIKNEMGIVTDEEYQLQLRQSLDQVKDKSAFYSFYNDVQSSQDILVYKKGYQALFAMNTDERDIRMSVLMIATLVFALHGIYTFDNQKSENQLYESTKKGRCSRYKSKLIVVLAASILLYMFYNLSDFLVFNKIYPMFQWDAPLYAVLPDGLKISTSLSLNLSCIQYASLLYVVRLLGILFSGYTIFVISKRMDNLLISSFISLLILIFPMLLYYNEASFLLHVTFFDLVQGNLFLYKNYNIMKIIVVVILFGWFTIHNMHENKLD